MSTADYYVEKAKQAQDDRQTDEAIGYIKRAMEIEPARTGLWVFLGCLQDERDDFGPALVSLERALELGHNHAAVHSAMGRCAEGIGMLEKAELAFLKSIELKPTSPTYVLLGHVQERLDKDAEAEASYRTALRIDPRNDEAMINLAIYFRLRKKPEKAIPLLREAIAIDPDYALAYEELGASLGREGEWEEAERMLRKAIALDDARPWAHMFLGLTLEILDDPNGAEEEYFRAADISPTLDAPHRWLGKLYKSQGRDSEAEHHYHRAAELQDEEMDGDPVSDE